MANPRPPQNPQLAQIPKPLTPQQMARLKEAKLKEFEILEYEKVKLGYRNREDITALPPGVLITGSQNVITDVTGRINSRQGYTLDGTASSVAAPILGAFDWETHIGITQHLRSGFLTSAGNDGKLQFRYVNSVGTVVWPDLLTGLTSTKFNFSDFWNTTNSQAYLLMVNGTNNLYEWSGGTATFASATANTITLQGSGTFSSQGFYTTNPGTYQVTIDGVVYTATGGFTTGTLTGVTPDPTMGGISVGDLIFQTPRTVAISGFSSGPGTLTIDGIANLRNQIYLGSLLSNQVFISKTNDYTSYAFTSPVRVVGEGALVTMDAPWRGFAPQESDMYITAGLDQWYATQFTLSSDLTKESFQITRLKTGTLQAGQSQALISNEPNSIIFISNEPFLNSLGRVDKVILTPQITELSYPVVNDFKSYDFTDGSVKYCQKFIYVAVPKSQLIRIYNMSDPKHQYWEAPQTIPISRFSIINGLIFGHSYLTSDTYQLFTGYTDNGHPYISTARFSYNNFGIPHLSKSFNKVYVEGYISPPTQLTLGVDYDLDGNQTETTYTISGTDTQIVATVQSKAALGKEDLGINPLGGDVNVIPTNASPPKFRVIKTFVRVPFYEESTFFQSDGINQQWSILRFGPAEAPTSEGQNDITQ